MFVSGIAGKKMQMIVLVLTGVLLVLAMVFLMPNGTILSGDILINEVCCHNETVIYNKKGIYADYVELYNRSGETINLADYRLSDGITEYDIPGVDVAPGEYKVIFLDSAMTDLQLGDNDIIYLCDRYGNSIDGVNIPVVEKDKAYAKNASGSNWVNNCVPTPGKINEYISAEDKLLAGEEYIPQLGAESGFYEDEFYLEITAPEGYDVFYTLDGSRPTEESVLYTAPILIKDVSDNSNLYSVIEEAYTWKEKGDIPQNSVDKCNVVRAIAISKEGYVSEEAIGSYFVGFRDKEGYDKTYTLSLVTDPENLFSHEHGIFVGGKVLENNPMEDESRPYRATANYSGTGKGWHREAYVELFEPSGEKKYSQPVEIGIHGNFTKAYPQKALNLFAETKKNPSGYLFEGLFGGKNRSLMLRPGGANDCRQTQFRDALNHKLMEETEATVLLALPCQVFIDGEYWGLYNLQERIEQGLLSKKYAVDEDDIIVMKFGNVVTGTAEYQHLYEEFVHWISYHDMSKEENYRKACEMMDIQSYIDYYCFHIYVAACDQLSNNVSVWKTKTVSNQAYYDGKWRWIIYDTDDSLGVLEQYSRYDVDSFTAGHMDATPMTDSVFLSLLRNKEFKERFVENFYRMEDEIFHTDRVNEIIDGLVCEYMDAAVASHKRWHHGEYTEADYMTYVDVVKEFFEKRRPYIEKYMIEALDLE